MRDGLGIGHAVTFEMRGKHERVGLRIKLCQVLRRHRAEHGNALFQRVTGDIGIKPCGGIAVARAAAVRLPTWQQSADIFARALERLA